MIKVLNANQCLKRFYHDRDDYRAAVDTLICAEQAARRLFSSGYDVIDVGDRFNPISDNVDTLRDNSVAKRNIGNLEALTLLCETVLLPLETLPGGCLTSEGKLLVKRINFYLGIAHKQIRLAIAYMRCRIDLQILQDGHA